MRSLLLISLLLISAEAPVDRLAAAMDAYARHHDRAAAHGFELLAMEDGAVAETMLGVMYANGRIGRPDPAAAASYWLRAAQRGYPPAQLALARAFGDGRGVRRDPAMGYEWALVAARQGDGDARSAALALARALKTRIGAVEAERREHRAAQWQPVVMRTG